MVIIIDNEKRNVTIKVKHYIIEKGICLSIVGPDGRERTELTREILFPGIDIPPYCGFLNTEGLPNAPAFVRKYGLGEPCYGRRGLPIYNVDGPFGLDGVYPLYQFFPDKLEELDPEGIKHYREHIL